MNIGWQPWATSTPIKNNARVSDKSLPQKPLVKGTDLVYAILGALNTHNKPVLKQSTQSCKKVAKNRSYFFDVASSSDEDEPPKKCKISEIKIRSENNKKIKLSLNNPQKEKILCKKDETSKELQKKRKNIFTVSDTKKKKYQDIFKDEKTVNIEEKLATSYKLALKDKTGDNNNKKIVNDEKSEHKLELVKENKENLETCIQGLNQKKRTENDFDQSREFKSSNVVALEKSLEPTIVQKSVKDVTNENLKDDNNKNLLQKVKDDFSSLEINISKVRNNQQNAACCNRKKKRQNKKVQNDLQVQKHVERSVLLKKKRLSHQLFSDSKGQELINSLDLSQEEVDNDCSKSLHKESSTMTFVKTPIPKSKTELEATIHKVQKSDRETKKQPTKNSEVPEIQTSMLSTNKKEEKFSKTSKKIKTSRSKLQQINSSMAIVEKCQPDISGIRFGCKSENIASTCTDKIFVQNISANVTNDPDVQNLSKHNCREERKQNLNSKVNLKKKKSVTVSQKAKKMVTNNKRDIGEEESKGEDGKAPGPVNLVLFKQLSQLEFSKETEQMCSTTECWSLKNFKCGVFKVNNNAQITSKTAFNDSYLGCVLLKGKVKIKIGSEELYLEEGDMAFVPPLTEWSALNFTENESIMYYWSGRFKA